MKKTFLFLTLSAVILYLYSCGGVVGNIKKYSFRNVTPGNLKAALNRVYDKYPELIKSDTTMYGMNNGEDFYYAR